MPTTVASDLICFLIDNF